MQTNPTFYRNAEAIVAQAMHFHGLAPNIQVKIPATLRGHRGDRRSHVSRGERERHGLLHAAASHRRGRGRRARVARRAAAGQDTASMTPVCTLMIGRLDDWLKVVAKKDEHCLDARAPRLGWHRRDEEGLRHLPTARLPGPPAGGRVPASPALVGVDRRRPRPDHSLRVAASVQPLGYRGQEAHAESGGPGGRGGTLPEVRRFPARLRRKRDEPGGVRPLRSDRADASHVYRLVRGTAGLAFATSCCRTRTRNQAEINAASNQAT